MCSCPTKHTLCSWCDKHASCCRADHPLQGTEQRAAPQAKSLPTQQTVLYPPSMCFLYSPLLTSAAFLVHRAVSASMAAAGPSWPLQGFFLLMQPFSLVVRPPSWINCNNSSSLQPCTVQLTCVVLRCEVQLAGVHVFGVWGSGLCVLIDAGNTMLQCWGKG